MPAPASAPNDVTYEDGSGVRRRQSEIVPAPAISTASPSSATALPRIEVAGVPVSVAPLANVCAWLLGAAHTRGREPKVVSFASASTLGNAWRANALRRADVVLAEGRGPSTWTLLAGPTPRCDAGNALTALFASATVEAPLRVFLFGGARGRARLAAEWMKWEFPGVLVVGVADSGDGATVVEEANEACADVLVVGLGDEASDVWIAENAPLLDVGLVIAAGEVIDAMGGDASAHRRATRPSSLDDLVLFLVRAVLAVAFGASVLNL